MPRDELDAFDRHYLDHGLPTTWDGSITMLAGTGVGGGTLDQLDDLHRRPPKRSATAGSASTASRADGRCRGRPTSPPSSPSSASRSRPTSRPRTRSSSRGGGAGLGGGPDAPQRDACGDCGSCAFGCRRGTKQSGIRVHLAEASAAGARIVAAERGSPESWSKPVRRSASRALSCRAIQRRPSARPPRPRAAGGARRRRTPNARHPAALGSRASGHRPVPASPPGPGHRGSLRRAVEMWRGTLQGPALSSSPNRTRVGTATSSSPLPATPASRSGPAVGGHRGACGDGRIARLSPLIAVTRDGGRGPGIAHEAGRVRIDYRARSDRDRDAAPCAVPMARLARAAGAADIVASGPRRVVPPGRPAGRRRARSPGSSSARDVRLRAQSRRGLLRPPDGFRPDGRDPAGQPAIRGARPRRGEPVVGGLYVADASLFPTGLGVNPMLTSWPWRAAVRVPPRADGRGVRGRGGPRRAGRTCGRPGSTYARRRSPAASGRAPSR